jgi:hypothetical protein
MNNLEIKITDDDNNLIDFNSLERRIGIFTGHLTLACAGAPVAGTDVYAVLGIMYRLFSRQSVNNSGSQWETVVRPAESVNMLTQMTIKNKGYLQLKDVHNI